MTESMKKFFLYLMVVFLVAGVSGCASVEKKFTRKKKAPEHVAAAVYIEQGSYQKKYSNEYYYKTHFTYWESWQDEFLKSLGGNSKKVERCAEEALSQLVEMNRYLVPAKQAELKPMLDSLGQIVDKIERGNYSKSDHASMKEELEKIKRIVSNNFYFDKVKDSLLPDKVDLGTATAEPVATQAAPVK